MAHLIHKDLGNDAYKRGDYDDAIDQYSLAIGSARAVLMDEDLKKQKQKRKSLSKLRSQLASYYTNRAACFEKLKHFRDALKDCQEAIRVDGNCLKAYLREARLHLNEGALSKALPLYEMAFAINKEQTAKVRDQAFAVQRKYKRSVQVVERLRKRETNNNNNNNNNNNKKKEEAIVKEDELKRAVEELSFVAKVCNRWRIPLLYKAETLYALGMTDEAFELTCYLLQKNSVRQDSRLLMMRSHILLKKSKPADAMAELKTLLKWDPDNKTAQQLFRSIKLLIQKKAQADQAYKDGQFHNGLQLYSSAMEACPATATGILANLHYNRASTHLRLRSYRETVCDCTEAIRRDGKNIKAYLQRATTYMSMEFSKTQTERKRHCEQAVQDYERAMELSKTNEQFDEMEILKKLRKAVMELRRVTRKDYYKILGVTKTATTAELKKKFRKLALQYHPDRQFQKTEQERKAAEELFQEANMAYQTLSDPEKRTKYDQEGFDSQKGSNLHIPHPVGRSNGTNYVWVQERQQK